MEELRANENKNLEIQVGEEIYLRYAIPTHYVQIGEDYIEIVKKYVAPHYKEGNVLYDGKNLKKMNLDNYRNTDIGIVFQSYNLLPSLTAIENIILSMDVSKVKVKNKKQKALELMKSVGLSEEHAKRKILKLSGGEQQRIAIARSLSYNPKIIIADEPTGNLDKDTENEILKIFKHLAKDENKCIIIVTHSQNVSDNVDIVYELGKSN